jgi:Zn-dependent protease with chaperone function
VGAIVFAGLIGWAIGYLFGTGPAGIVIALAVATVLSITSYFSGDRIVLASTHAREVTPEEQPRLHNVVEGLAIAAGLPKPRVYVVPEQAPNAFATGRDPEHSSIAVTEGLLAMMNRVELEGVIAHEMSHVQDRDILVGTVVATVVGAAVLLSEFFMRAWFWGGVLVCGLIVSASGFVLDFPNFNQTRNTMQISNIVHLTIASLFMLAALGHIYMGTLGMAGAYDAMSKGYVDETWAKEHHLYWYNDVKAGKVPTAPDDVPAPAVAPRPATR